MYDNDRKPRVIDLMGGEKGLERGQLVIAQA